LIDLSGNVAKADSILSSLPQSEQICSILSTQGIVSVSIYGFDRIQCRW
jgi:hypothetical protein